MTEKEVSQYSPLTLAFMGDAVYEGFTRKMLVERANMPVRKLHELASKLVCAEFQAAAVQRLIDEGKLSEHEQEIFRHGRNAGGVSAPKHSTVAQYRAATGLECLFGYLCLTDNEQRAEEIFSLIMQEQTII